MNRDYFTKELQHEQEDFYEDMSNKIDKEKIYEEKIEQTEQKIRNNIYD